MTAIRPQENQFRHLRGRIKMQIEPKPEQRLFDVSAAAAYLQSIGATAASKNFIRGLIASGQVPHLKIGKRFFVSRTALDGWLSNRETRFR
jgi:excisionase family DNA binding protein